MTAFLLGVLLGAAPTAARPTRPEIPVQVRCDDMVVEDRHALARCTGHVVAIRQNVTLTCDRAVASYDGSGRVRNLTCLGRVHVVQRIAVAKSPPAPSQAAAPPSERIADGDKGVYREESRTLTLTGHATLVQGADRLAGEPIVFYVDEDRVVAEGAKLVGRAEDAVVTRHADGGTP